MNFPLYVAKRYLFSKKSTHVINVISGISIAGVAVATLAMVVTLSVFNGFHDLVATLFTSFDPEIKVVPVKGKMMPEDDPLLTKMADHEGIDIVSRCFEDNALAMYGDRQEMVSIKGVDDKFADLVDIKNILYGDGEYCLQAANLQYAVPGINLAAHIGMGSYQADCIKIYAPRREGQLDMANPTTGFVQDSLLSSGLVFAVKQSVYDDNYILTSLPFARNLFDGQGMITSMEMKVKPGYDVEEVKKDLQTVADGKYDVQNRYEQQHDTFKIMKIEKFIAYIFLTFILVVACFNIIGSLSMLIIDKKKDVATLRSLGASDNLIIRIFLFEGRMITIAGAIIGIILGLILCLLQQEYGLVSLGGESGNFVIDAYPVSVHVTDIIAIFVTVTIVGFVSARYPVRYFAKKILLQS